MVPARDLRAADRLLHFRAIKTREPFGREIDHGGFALRRQIAAERARDIDDAERRAGDVGKDCRGVRVGRFLENQIVAFEPQRIAVKLERNVVVAAERHPAERVDLVMAKVGT